MPMDRLTQRATSIIAEFAGQNTVDNQELLVKLVNSSGLSGLVLKEFPDIKIKRGVTALDALVVEAFYQASRLEHPYVGTEHLLLALLSLTKSKDFSKVREYLHSTSVFPKAMLILRDKKDTVLLNTYGKNLTREVFGNYQEPYVTRDEVDRLVSIFLKRDNPNALIIGEPGVGKDTLVKLLVRTIASLDVPPLLAGYQVIEFDLMSFVSSIANKGGVEFSLMTLEEELRGLKRVIVSIKNFQNLFVATQVGVGVPILYPMLNDVFVSSGISFVATMNTGVYDKVIMDNEHILENFSILDLPEPDEKKTMEILAIKAKTLGEFHNVTISEKVLKQVYKTADEEISGTSFPQKGIDLLDVACANLLVKKSKVPSEYKNLVDETVTLFSELDAKLAAQDYEVAEKTKLRIDKVDKKLTQFEDKMVFSKPLVLSKDEIVLSAKEVEKKEELTTDDLEHLLDLPHKLKEEIISQDVAVDAVANALVRAKLGLRSKKRPIGAFLFLGPTGVGKTELAKVLAKYAFAPGGASSKNHLIRLDMSDFAEKHTVSRLVGAPPGYIGYGDGGELTQKIENVPDSVVLFDEIEKAHPDVLNVLLQIMEEGELADAKGNTYDFSKAVVILTSNLGTEILHGHEIGFVESVKTGTDAKIESHLIANLKKILKPELVNRFDEVIVFKRLTRQAQTKILELLLKEVLVTLKKQGVKLKVTSDVKKWLLDVGYSTEYGARELRRAVERELLDKVAHFLLTAGTKKKRKPITILELVAKVNTKASNKEIVIEKKTKNSV